jgi:acetyl esterase/lipase
MTDQSPEPSARALSEILSAIIAAVPADFADPRADWQAVRAMMAPFHAQPCSRELEVDVRDCGGVPTGFYKLPLTDDCGVIAMHCHGGAFVSCPLSTYHFYAEMIARALGMPVAMPDYRLAPEHHYPAAHDDCFDCYRGLLESGIEPARICVLGESCGGSLGLGALLRARDAGLPMPGCFVSVTGWFDLSVPGTPRGHDPFLTPGWVRNRANEYTGGALDLTDPRISPARADLRGLPPIYLQVAEFDTMADGAIALAGAAVHAGVELTLESWPGLIHGWHGLANAGVPEALSAWAAIRAYVDRCLGRDNVN